MPVFPRVGSVVPHQSYSKTKHLHAGIPSKCFTLKGPERVILHSLHHKGERFETSGSFSGSTATQNHTSRYAQQKGFVPDPLKAAPKRSTTVIAFQTSAPF